MLAKDYHGGRHSGPGDDRRKGKAGGLPDAEDAFALGHEERLQKFLSHAGIESRRQCEQMILDGRVRVNGKMVTELGAKVNPGRDQVHVDGNRVHARPQSEVYWIALNKPKGVVCTVSDELGRPTAVAAVPRGREMRLVPVGRLDRDSCGLLLLTNENSWINPLTHPSYGHEKTYRVTITSGYPTPQQWDMLTRGMLLDGDPNPTRPCVVEVVDFDRRKKVTTLDIIIREGKNRQIRRMFEGIGHQVKSITRIAHGPIRLKNLRPGEWRELAKWEITKLKNLTTKTLKSPERPAEAPAATATPPRVRNASSQASAPRQLNISSRHPLSSSKVLSQPRNALDDEEDAWNSSNGFRRSGARKRGGIVPNPRADEDDYEWKTTSWAREQEGAGRRGGGWQRSKKKDTEGRKKAETEGDAILRKVAQGIKMDVPRWEGGGRVEQSPGPQREEASRRPWERMGKGSWDSSARRRR